MADKRLVGPMEIVISPGAPIALFNKLTKAVAALTLAGHTVSVLAKPYADAPPARGELKP